MSDAELERALAVINKLSKLADKISATFNTDHSVDVQMRATAYQIRAIIAGEGK